MPVTDSIFWIAYHDQEFRCKKLEINNQVLFAVDTIKQVLYLTVANDSEGNPFWTCIPSDPAKATMVNNLGKKIEQLLNKP